jgi:hypothetical protein
MAAVVYGWADERMQIHLPAEDKGELLSQMKEAEQLEELGDFEWKTPLSAFLKRSSGAELGESASGTANVRARSEYEVHEGASLSTLTLQRRRWRAAPSSATANGDVLHGAQTGYTAGQQDFQCRRWGKIQ